MEMILSSSGLLLPKEKPEPPKPFDWDAYYEQHKFCPKCGGDGGAMLQTTSGCIGHRDQNSCSCNCGWRGSVDDLVPNSVQK